MISSPNPSRADARARELLQSAQRVLLFGHERPDGDVLGSQVGLAWALAERGAEVAIVNPDLPEAPFDFLEPPLRFEAYSPDQPLPDHDLAVMLDCSELSRAGELGPALRRGGAPIVVVDHHVPPAQPWWDAALHDPSAAATGMVVWRWIRSCGLPICPPQAIGLFTAIATDTGWFRHPNTDAEVLDAVAELVRAGAYPDRIHRALFRRRKIGHMRALATLLEQAELFHGGRLALIEVEADLDNGADAGESAREIMRAVESVEVVLLLRSLPGGRTKLSARGDGDHDVFALAQRFGGGGHRRAAGAKLDLPLPAARVALLDAAAELFEGGR